MTTVNRICRPGGPATNKRVSYTCSGQQSGIPARTPRHTGIGPRRAPSSRRRHEGSPPIIPFSPRRAWPFPRPPPLVRNVSPPANAGRSGRLTHHAESTAATVAIRHPSRSLARFLPQSQGRLAGSLLVAIRERRRRGADAATAAAGAQRQPARVQSRSSHEARSQGFASPKAKEKHPRPVD